MNKEDFICLCNFVSIKDTIKLIKEGKDTLQIKKETSLGNTCGKCLKQLDELIEEHKSL